MVLSEKYPSIFPLFCRTRSNAFCHSHLGTFSLSIRTQVQFPVTFNCWRAPIAIMVSANDSVAVRRRTVLSAFPHCRSFYSIILFASFILSCLSKQVVTMDTPLMTSSSSSSCHNNEVLLNITTFLKKRLFVAFSSSSFCCCCVVLLFHYYIVTITLLQVSSLLLPLHSSFFLLFLSGGADSVSE